MKLLIFLMALGLNPPESRVDRFPQSSSPYSGCDSKEVASGIAVGEKLPRSAIFHYGKKELLMKDVAEGNVPQADWDEFIMSHKTRFKLKRFRRGFYGTEYVEDADRFGDATYNWLVEIKLKESCLKPERVVSLVYLGNSAAFKTWYESKSYRNSFSDWKFTCFDSGGYPRSKYFVGHTDPDQKQDFEESACEQVVADYYESKKFAFVLDHEGDLVRSWAIRDRDCIEDILGSDEYWSEQFSKRSEFWTNTCNRERNHRNNIRVWFAAMAKKPQNTAQLKKFAEMIKLLTPPDDRLDWYSQELDRFAAQDFADVLWNASKRCVDKKTFQNKLEQLSKSVDQMQSSDVKKELESVCR